MYIQCQMSIIIMYVGRNERVRGESETRDTEKE